MRPTSTCRPQIKSMPSQETLFSSSFPIWKTIRSCAASRWHVLAASGTSWPCRGHRIAPNLAHLVPLEGGSMRPWRGVISSVERCCWSRRVSVRSQATLRRPKLGTLLSCVCLPLFLPLLCRSGLRCDCGKGGCGGASRIAQPEED